MKRPASIDADVQAQQHSVIPGQKVWIPDPDKKKCWVLTTVAGSFTYGTATVTTEQGIELDVDINSILDYDSTHDLMLSDISDMNDLHEGPLLALLERRFRSKRIHTWCSDVLVALNPFQAVDISPEVEGSKPPSIEAVARAVVEELQAQLKQQSILVSGESGAGKTFAARAVIRELVGMSLLNRRSEARRRASLQSLPDDARVLSQYYERKLEQHLHCSRPSATRPQR
jgi:myosin heavy subunit